MSASTDPKYMVLLTEAQMRAVAHALYTLWSPTAEHNEALGAVSEKLVELAQCRAARAGGKSTVVANLVHAKGSNGRVPTGVVIDEVWGDVGTSLEAQITKHFSKEPGNG